MSLRRSDIDFVTLHTAAHILLASVEYKEFDEKARFKKGVQKVASDVCVGLLNVINQAS